MKRRSIALAVALACASSSCAHEGLEAPSTGGPARVVLSTPAPATAATSTPLRKTPDAPFRASAPALTPLPPFTEPPIRSFRLSNGLRVLFFESHWPALVRVEIVGRRAAGPPGVGALLGHVPWLGTSAHTEAELAATRDELLGQSFDWATPEAVGTGLTAPSAQAEEAVALLAEATLDAKTPAPPAIHALRVVSEQVKHEDAAASRVAARVLTTALYRWDHPEDVRAVVRADDVGKLTRDDLARAYDASFDPATSTILVVGDTTEDAIRPILEQRFGPWTKRAARPRAPAAPRIAEDTPRVVVVDRPGAADSYALFGGRGPAFGADDWAAARVMREIFGDAHGRAARAIVDERHLAWRVTSDLVANGATPRFTCGLELPGARTGEGLRAIADAMRSLRDGDAGDEELRDARDRLVLAEPQWLTTVAWEADVLEGIAIHGLRPDDPPKRPARLAAVTAADVRRAAKAYLDPDRMKVVVVGDWSALRDQLAGLSWGPIEIRDTNGVLVRVEPGGSR